MIEIEKKLSMMAEKHKHVMYLITEDRDILKAVFAESADTLKGYLLTGAGEGFGNTACGKVLQTANRDSFYRVAQTNGILADAYEVFDLKERDYFADSAGESPGKERTGTSPVFFLLNDFHIVRDKTTAPHFLKQFLVYAETEEKDHGRNLLLFLVSPVMKLPEGFEREVEIVDVPEMDEEDIRVCLLAEAAKEYEKDSFAAAKWKKEPDPVDWKRICEAANDFRGISGRGIREIAADLKAEYGSFFGRTADATGSEDNLRGIRSARKQKITEYKKNEARFDPTVTMLEPGVDMAGLGGFVEWIADIREEFVDAAAARRSGNEPPGGVLLTGIPGSGKTQAARMAARMLGGEKGNVPLVQFRMDNLLGGLVGDSEANFKRCRKRIEALAPCIVLLDEMEKTFHMEDGGSKNDVKMNILTALLDWMQENRKQIFFFGTSNSVAGLRPELLRDGRFDMRFSVFMPTCDELAEIFCLHMSKANERAGGQLFSIPEGRGQCFPEYEKAARGFLREITAYAREERQYLFYTGANVKNLITLANRSLRRKMDSGRLRRCTMEQYQQELLEAAKGAYSQPYGMTNPKDIAGFWLAANEHRYTNAGTLDLFPFAAYNPAECRFEEEKLPARTNEYDQYLFECISAEIIRLHRERKGVQDSADGNGRRRGQKAGMALRQ